MRSAIRRLLPVLVLTLLSGFITLSAAPAQASSRSLRGAEEQPGCQDTAQPPPAVDTSEQPKPGQQEPQPLPVPDPPIGGNQLAACGPVVPEGAAPPPGEATAESWVVHDLDSGEVLAAKNAHARNRPASLIKTLLALVVVNELKPDMMLTASQEDASQECTCVGLTAGTHYTVDALMHGLLMHSGNDVAHVLAGALGGEQAALDKMNALANKIGAKDTRASTASGLDGPGMSSSAYDLSLIFHYAMKQPKFAESVGTKEYVFPGAEGQPGFPIYNDNKLLGSYPGFLGGKTGFTDDARHTYVGGAERDGKRLAVVLMRGEQQPVRMTDQAAQLLDYGFTLASGDAKPVGEINYSQTQLAGDAANSGDGGSANAQNTAARSETTTSSGSVIVLIVLGLALAGFIVVRRNRKPDRS